MRTARSSLMNSSSNLHLFESKFFTISEWQEVTAM